MSASSLSLPLPAFLFPVSHIVSFLNNKICRHSGTEMPFAMVWWTTGIKLGLAPCGLGFGQWHLSSFCVPGKMEAANPMHFFYDYRFAKDKAFIKALNPNLLPFKATHKGEWKVKKMKNTSSMRSKWVTCLPLGFGKINKQQNSLTFDPWLNLGIYS